MKRRKEEDERHEAYRSVELFNEPVRTCIVSGTRSHRNSLLRHLFLYLVHYSLSSSTTSTFHSCSRSSRRGLREPLVENRRSFISDKMFALFQEPIGTVLDALSAQLSSIVNISYHRMFLNTFEISSSICV